MWRKKSDSFSTGPVLDMAVVEGGLDADCLQPVASMYLVGTWQSQHLSLRQLSESWAGFYPDRNYVCLGLCSQGSLIFVLTWKEGWTKGEIFLQISAQGMRFEKYVPFLELMTQSR